MHGLIHFLKGAGREVVRGGRAYYAWLACLGVAIGIGLLAYAQQAQTGLIATHLRDQVSWGFYIANFAFLVGIAAAAVLLVIPAYLFHRQDVKQVVLIGEGLAVLEGVDDLLHPLGVDDHLAQRAAIEAAVKAVESGRIPRARLDEALGRVAALARRFVHGPEDLLGTLGSPAHRQLAQGLGVEALSGRDPTER